MTYETTEKSVQSGRPRELYTFQLGAGVYRLTSSKEDETHGGLLYTATPGLSRGNVKEAPVGERAEVVVTLPITHAIAVDLLANGIPPRTATVTINRFHDPIDTLYRVHHGGLAEIETDDQYARLRSPRLLDLAFDVKVPIFKASRLCQHALYGPGCQAPRGGANVTVLAVSGTAITLDILDPDGYLDGGEIVRIDDNEPRTILEQVGQNIVVDVPFRTLAVGETVNIVPGCDGVITTCRDKFANVANFGGHPDLPHVNPSTSSMTRRSPTMWELLKR